VQAQGFELFSGTAANIANYYSFYKIVDGEFTHVQRYATTDTTDDALRAINRFADDPWFIAVSFNAGHTPFHAPPSDLHSFDLAGAPSRSPLPHYKAAVEALDTELARLIEGIPDAVFQRTHIVFVGDNGTLGTVTTPPFRPEHAKSTLYEGGVNVPLILAGPSVAAPGSVCNALVNTTDVFATVLELCGVPSKFVPPPGVVLDSVSLAPYLGDPGLPSLRGWVFSEKFWPNHNPLAGARCIRGVRYKLIHDWSLGTEQLFDLELDPFEQRDLLGAPLASDAQVQLAELRARLCAIIAG
jgi:arylsulfatase A-like enzyme